MYLMTPAYPPMFAAPVQNEASTDRTYLLIRAAYDLLDESGLEGLTVRAVLSRAGLARRAFYERFQGKDDLVLAVFDSSLRAAALQFKEITARCEGPLESLEAIVTGIVLGQLGQGQKVANRRGAALSREHLRLAQTRPAELDSALGPLLNLIAGHVADGMSIGIFRQADPQMQSRLLYNLVSTTVHTVLLAEEGSAADIAAREGLAQEVWEFCRRAMLA